MLDRAVLVPMPYWLFSQMKSAGMDQSFAMLSASKIWPWLDAPSPYMAMPMFDGHGLPDSCALYISAKAMPTPTGTCRRRRRQQRVGDARRHLAAVAVSHLCPHDARAAPELVLARVEVHGAALALLAADGEAVELRRNVAYARPPQVLDAVAPVGRDDVVVLRDRCLNANRNGLLEHGRAGTRQSVLGDVTRSLACPKLTWPSYRWQKPRILRAL